MNISQMCSSLKYELGEFCSAMQKFQSSKMKDLESQNLKLYLASTSQVFDPTTLIGRIRMLLDQFWKWMSSQNGQITLQDSIEHIIHNLFDRVVLEGYKARQAHLAHHIQHIESYFELRSDPEIKEGQKARYSKCLEDELNGSKANIPLLSRHFHKALKKGALNPTSLDRLRHVVTNVSHSVKPFWYKMLYNRSTFGLPLQAYIPEFQEKPQDEKSIDWAINDSTLYHALSKEQDIIDLEHLLQQDIPTVELIKICHPHLHLSESERRKLDAWIKGLNTLSAKFQDRKNPVNVVGLLKNALTEVAQAAAIQGHFQIHLEMLINKLDDYGCRLTSLEDRNHVVWRRGLKPGSIITCEGEIFEVGEEIGAPDMPGNEPRFKKKFRVLPIKRDKFKIFHLVNKPNLVVKIGSSPFDLAIATHRFKEYHCGIPAVAGVERLNETDEQRPVLFLEKLPVLLSKHIWTSDGCHLKEEDEKILSRVASVLLCMRDWKKWLRGLTSERLGLNASQVLCSLDSLEGEEDNYLAAENFCIETAKKGKNLNDPALRYLMEVSEYSKHPMAVFYRKNVVSMLKTGKFDYLNFSLPHGFNRSEYKKRVRDLFEQAKALRFACEDEVSKLMDEKIKRIDNQKNELLNEIADLKTQVRSDNKIAKRKKHEMAGEIYQLKDKIKDLNASFAQEFLSYTSNWQHFAAEKDQLIHSLSKNSAELKKNKKELKNNTSNRKELFRLNKDLELQIRETYSEIITYAVYERLLQAYNNLPTSAWLPDSLYDTVVNSFKDNSGLKNPVIDYAYYKKQRELIVAKNLKAIEQNQDKKNKEAQNLLSKV